MVGNLRARCRRLAVCHAVRKLLLARGRLLLDGGIGTRLGRLYVIGDYGGIWPLSDESQAVQRMLAHAGLNVREQAAHWLLADLAANYDEALLVDLARYWTTKDGKVYISSGPTEMVRASLKGAGVELKLLPNGADDEYFASDAVVRMWRPTKTGLEPVAISAFSPNLVAPDRVPSYSPGVQGRLLSAWLVALIAGIRPLPILAAIGGRGGGKTTLIKAVTEVVSCDAPTSLGSDQRDLWTIAANQPVLGLDNVDSAPPSWFPDFLAGLTTQVSHLRRKLYSDADTNRSAPDAVAAISTRTAAFARADVADRTLPIFTSVFDDRDRIADSDLLEEVRENRDAVLTYLARAAVKLADRLGHAPVLPCRFVDFGRMVWASDESSAASDLAALRQAQALTVGDADPLIRAILDFADQLLGRLGRWEGRPSQLAQKLKNLGAGLPHMSGRETARRLREGRETLGQFKIRVSEGRSGNNTLFTLGGAEGD